MSFLRPLLRASPGRLRLVNVRNGRVVADHLLTAFDSAARNKGLLGRQSLAEGSALVIAPSNAIHTCFMKFSIDVAFVSKQGRVLKVRVALPPWRAALALRAHAVIELAAGALRQSDTVPGDEFVIRPATRPDDA
jgi:uncharacterized protein